MVKIDTYNVQNLLDKEDILHTARHSFKQTNDRQIETRQGENCYYLL